MKKIACALLLAFTLYNCGGGDSKKQNEADVDLTDSTQNVANDTLGFWMVKNSDQDSLRQRNNQYVQINGLGTYSNSTLVNSPLFVVITVDSARCDINMSLYEGSDFIEKDSLTFNVQDSKTNNYQIKTYAGQVLKDDANKSDSLFRAILKRGGAIDFNGSNIILGAENSFKFIVNDADHFQDAMNAIKQ